MFTYIAPIDVGTRATLWRLATPKDIDKLFTYFDLHNMIAKQQQQQAHPECQETGESQPEGQQQTHLAVLRANQHCLLQTGLCPQPAAG